MVLIKARSRAFAYLHTTARMVRGGITMGLSRTSTPLIYDAMYWATYKPITQSEWHRETA